MAAASCQQRTQTNNRFAAAADGELSSSGQKYFVENIRGNYHKQQTNNNLLKVSDDYNQHSEIPSDNVQCQQKYFYRRQIFSDIQDKISSRSGEDEDNETSANYAANEALIGDEARDWGGDIEVEAAEFAAGTRLSENEGEVVCTLMIPDPWLVSGPGVVGDGDNNSCLLTPDSDIDSGCFSEELATTSRDKSVVSPGINPPVDVDTKKNSELNKIKRGGRDFARPIYKQIHASRLFQRQIWKRRNGWFRVRKHQQRWTDNVEEARDDVRCVDGVQPGVRVQGVRSQLSEPELPESAETRRGSCLLRDSAAKEFEAETEKEKLTSQDTQEEDEEDCLSDNDQQLEIFPNTSDTIKVNGDRGSEYDVHSSSCQYDADHDVSDIQMQLARMRLEIAQMVAEAEHLDHQDSSVDEDDSEDDEENGIYDLHLSCSNDEEYLSSDKESITDSD